jgi:hypothetical protein
MNKKTAVHWTVPPYNVIADWWLVVPSMFLRSCNAIKIIIICIQQNTQAYFQSGANELCSSLFQACSEHCWDWAANLLKGCRQNKKLLDVIAWSC